MQKYLDVKISFTAKGGDNSLLDINDHLRPENAIITKEIFSIFQRNYWKQYYLRG